VHTGNAKVGMDYYVSDKTTIGVGVNGIIKSGKKTSDVSSV
jgi:hypothetical protein